MSTDSTEKTMFAVGFGSYCLSIFMTYKMIMLFITGFDNFLYPFTNPKTLLVSLNTMKLVNIFLLIMIITFIIAVAFFTRFWYNVIKDYLKPDSSVG